VTRTLGTGQAWVIDPQTLKVKSKIPCPGPHDWFWASPGSATLFVLSKNDLRCHDLKTKRSASAQFQGGPDTRVGYRSLALSADGKSLFKQHTPDYFCNRYRVEGFTLSFDGSKMPKLRTGVLYQFSPDSKQIVMTHPSLVPQDSKWVMPTEVYST